MRKPSRVESTSKKHDMGQEQPWVNVKGQVITTIRPLLVSLSLNYLAGIVVWGVTADRPVLSFMYEDVLFQPGLINITLYRIQIL